VYLWRVVTASLPAARRPLLVRRSALGGFEDPAPRPTPAAVRGGRALLTLSSVMLARTADPVISLTYDDGPDPVATPALLDVLAEHGARATFFVLTDRAQAHPAIVRRALAEGHEIGLHGIDHTRLTRLPAREALRRVRQGRQRLEAITGAPVRWFRPTYGALGVAALAGVRALGLDTVIWSAWARDWEEAPAQVVADRVVTALHPGAIVLLHDTTDDEEARAAGPLPTFARADVARRVLAGMAAGGLVSVPVGDLLARYPAVRAVTAELPRLPFR